MTNAASLNPDDFQEGGGLVDDVDVVMKECRFEMFDYQGSVPEPVPSLKVLMTDDDGNDIDQYYSMGSAKDWIPSEDGKQLMSVGTATGIRASSNGGIFIKSLIDAGFPVDKMGSDISSIDGLKAHVIRVPAPKRSGIKQSAKQKEREEKYGPPTLLVVGEVISLPWEKTKPKGAPAGKKASAKAEAAPDQGDDVSEAAINAIMEILSENGTAAKKELPAKLFQSLKEDPNRNEIIKLAFDDNFLASGPWTYDDGVLVMG